MPSTKTFLAIALLAAVFLYHFSLIARYSINLPQADEWDQTQAWEPTLDLQWLIKPHNEHRIIPTRIQTWISANYDDANYRHQMLFSFVLFGTMLIVASLIFTKITPVPTHAMLMFLVFLLSTANWENHFSAFQSQFHFELLFLLCGTYFLFLKSANWLNTFLGTLSFCFSIYSFSAGVVHTTVMVTCFFLFALVFKRSHLQTAFVIFATALTIGLWFWGNHHATGHIPRTPLFHLATLNYFLNLVSYAFAIEGKSAVLGGLALLFPVAPFLLLLFQFKTLPADKKRSLFVAGSLLLSTLALLAATAPARTVLGIGSSKSARYNELGFMLVPLTFTLWMLYTNKKKQKAITIALFILIFIPYADNWTSRPYRDTHHRIRNGQLCLQQFYQFGGTGDCPAVYPHPIPDKYNLSRRYQFSFYKDAMALK